MNVISTRVGPWIAQLDPEASELLISVGAWGGGILLVLFLLLAFVKRFLVIGRPNELLVFSGRKHVDREGNTVGWRYIAGGRAIRWPIIERVDRMDLTVMPIDIQIRGAYARGNIPVSVDAIANAKISLEDPSLHHAIERFLGRSKDEIRQVAKETLEGTLRDVLAQLTPEQINHDRQELGERLRRAVMQDLETLGLRVDTFKIQHVTDDVNYLDSVSRVRIAEVIRDAEIAESDANRDAERAIAQAKSRGQVAVERAHAAIAEKSNELERVRAEWDAKARSEDERTIAAGLEERATAEQRLQLVRRDLEGLRLEADEVIPAQRESEAQALRAAGDAAIQAETGRAQGDALAALYGAWASAGDRAREVFLLQQIDHILSEIASVTDELDVRRVNLIDGGDGKALANYVASYPSVVGALLQQLEDIVGIDVASILDASEAEGARRSRRPRPASGTPPAGPGARVQTSTRPDAPQGGE